MYLYYRYKFRNKFFANWRHETRTRTRVIVVGALKECALSEAVHARALGTLRECFDGPRQSSTAFGRATGARPVPHSTRIAQCSSCSRRVFIPFTVGWAKSHPGLPVVRIAPSYLCNTITIHSVRIGASILSNFSLKRFHKQRYREISRGWNYPADFFGFD